MCVCAVSAIDRIQRIQFFFFLFTCYFFIIYCQFVMDIESVKINKLAEYYKKIPLQTKNFLINYK